MFKKIGTYRVELIVVLVFVLAGWKYTSGLENILDVRLADESRYLSDGVSLPAVGLQRAEFSPLYAVWYFILSRLQPDRIELYYLNYKLLTILLPILLYLVLRRYGVPVQAAMVVAFFFLISYANLVWPRISHFALLIILSFLLLEVFAKSLTDRLALGSVGALLSSYVRPELFLAFAILMTLYLGLSLKRFLRERVINIPVTVAVVLISLSLIVSLGLPVSSGNRSLIAFGQHFSLNWVAWTGERELSPMTDWEEIVRKNFGTVQGVTQAAVSNPLTFAKHVGSNIVHTPATFIKEFFLHAGLLHPVRSKRAEVIGLMVFLGIFFLLSWKRSKLTMKERIKSRKDSLLVPACYMIPVLLSVIIIFPREHYLLMLGVLLIIAVSILITEKGTERGPGIKRLALISLIAVAAVPAPYSAASATYRVNVETFRFIQSLHITDEVNLLEPEGGYATFSGPNFHAVIPYTKETDFDSFRSETGINMIILTERLKGDSRYKADKEWLSFLENCNSRGYVVMEIPGTNKSLIVERSLLHQ